MHKLEYSQERRVVDLVLAQGSGVHDCTCCLLGRISGDVLKMALGVGARVCLDNICVNKAEQRVRSKNSCYSIDVAENRNGDADGAAMHDQILAQ